MSVSPRVLAFMGLVLTNLFWASNAVVARFVSDSIPPITLSFGRWFLACLLLLPFVLSYFCSHFDHVKRVVSQRFSVILVLGLLGVSTHNTVLYLAAHETTAVNITLVSSTLPLITLLASWLMLSKRPTNWQLLGIVISLVGVVTIISGGDAQQLLNLRFNRGDILIFGIACCWSIYSVILGKYAIDLPPVVLLFVLIVAGLPFLSGLFFIEWLVLPSFTIGSQGVVVIVFVAIFPSILAFLFWGFGVKTLGPSITSLTCYLLPILTALLAVPILNESLYGYHYFGGLMILVGLYLGSVFRSESA